MSDKTILIVDYSEECAEGAKKTLTQHGIPEENIKWIATGSRNNLSYEEALDRVLTAHVNDEVVVLIAHNLGYKDGYLGYGDGAPHGGHFVMACLEAGMPIESFIAVTSGFMYPEDPEADPALSLLHRDFDIRIGGMDEVTKEMLGLSTEESYKLPEIPPPDIAS